MQNNEGIVVHGGTLNGKQIVVGRGAQATYTEQVISADAGRALRESARPPRARAG
jgi:hypothetical protein